MPEKADQSEALKRLGGGRWQTRDGRFTIEPQSGQWVIVDGEQTDELGLPRVRGPFPSLTRAKDAIAGARESAAPDSPLAERIASFERDAKKRPKRESAPTQASAGDDGRAAGIVSRPAPMSEPAEPTEPEWVADLAAADRLRARRLIDRLRQDGVDEAEELVHDELVEGRPGLAKHALLRRVEAIVAGHDGRAARTSLAGAIVELLADGEDERLDVGWRLVDRDGRPISVGSRDLEG